MFRTKALRTDRQRSSSAFNRQKLAKENGGSFRSAEEERIRNLTGLYLGADVPVGRSASAHPSVAPLARGRGMPSYRVKTPSEDRRYKKVELLRNKERKVGFSGNLLKRKKIAGTDITDYDVSSAHQSQVTFWDLTKQTARNFTCANNAGVTHLEYLSPEFEESQMPKSSAQSFVGRNLAKEIEMASKSEMDITGVIECYKKICRGDVEALLQLLPPQQALSTSQKKNMRKTGFTVKSYRNPNTAEIMATFPEQNCRPRTVGGYSTLPHPYFAKLFDGPHPKSGRDVNRNYNYSQPILHGHRIGEGYSHSTTAENRIAQRVNSPIDPKFVQADISEPTQPVDDPNVLQEHSEIINSDNTLARNTISIPKAQEKSAAEAVVDVEPSTSETLDTLLPSNHQISTVDDKELMAQSVAGNRLEKMPSGSEIIIGVEDEKGEQKPVEIDDTDDQPDEEVASNGSLRRKVSITERILKSKNSEEQAAHLAQEAENRKKQLVELLDEHAQIVHEVNSLQVHEDKENQENQQHTSDVDSPRR